MEYSGQRQDSSGPFEARWHWGHDQWSHKKIHTTEQHASLRLQGIWCHTQTANTSSDLLTQMMTSIHFLLLVLYYFQGGLNPILSVFLIFCWFFIFFYLKSISPLNNNLALNIAQQLYTELQERNNDLHTISHILPCFILVVLFKIKKPALKFKHKKLFCMVLMLLFSLLLESYLLTVR